MAPNLADTGEESVLAPDFTLRDTQGRDVKLSDYRGRPVVLVFTRGFRWPYCQRHLAQLRQDYAEFTRRGAEVVAIGPEGPDEFRRYWEEHQIPFVGLADPRHSVASVYGQEVNLLKLGRMPALIVVDGERKIRYRHHATWMSDIPANAEVLGVVDRLLDESHARAYLE